MITKFEVENFKCFKNFKIEGLSKINIITGDNNVGKSVLLEAIHLNINAQQPIDIGSAIFDMLSNRNLITSKYDKMSSLLYKNEKKLTVSSNFSSFSIEIKMGKELTEDEKNRLLEEYKKNLDFQNMQFIILDMNNGYEILPLYEMNNLLPEILNNNNYRVPSNILVSSNKSYSNSLKFPYEKIISLFKEEELLTKLKNFNSDIQKLNVINEMLQIKLSYLESYIPIDELGDGFIRILDILMSLIISKNKIILIDELENGIYYKKLYSFWKVIIEIMKDEDIQLFVTTHDKESIEALNRASEDMEFVDITSIELYKKEDTIYPIIRQYNSFNTTVASGMDVR